MKGTEQKKIILLDSMDSFSRPQKKSNTEESEWERDKMKASGCGYICCCAIFCVRFTGSSRVVPLVTYPLFSLIEP